MPRETLKIAITGHVDHGKSTTLGRLLLETNSLPEDKLKELKKISREFGKETELAYLADQLKEERERNITIETTEIVFKTRRRDYRLIDTPGHLEFIKNMITGASHADAAILIIDASEGVREQTRRHAYLLKLLSLNNVLVLLNKMDKLDYSPARFEDLRAEIRSFLEGLGVGFSALVPISAKEGANISRRSPKMPWYKGPTFLAALDGLRVKTQGQDRPLRFPVQDLYTVDGESIIAGRMASGTLRAGQTLTVLPAQDKTCVASIRVFGKNKSVAHEGESIGLTLSPACPVKRGDILAGVENRMSLPRSFRGNIFWLSEKPLASGERLTLRCSTQEIPCEVTNIEQRMDPANLDIVQKDASTLRANEAGIVGFRMLAPAVLENFADIPELGRYTIERNNRLQGAGTVIEKD